MSADYLAELKQFFGSLFQCEKKASTKCKKSVTSQLPKVAPRQSITTENQTPVAQPPAAKTTAPQQTVQNASKPAVAPPRVFELDGATTHAGANSFLKSQLARPAATVVAEKVPPKALRDHSSGKVFDLNQVSIWVGREAMNDICISGDESVENVHALITLDANGIWLSNKATSRCTELNGEAVTKKVKIGSGDYVRIGNVTLTAE